MLTSQRLFPGRTVKVHATDRIEVLLELDFDTYVRKVFTLDGVDLSDISDSQLSNAQHCLVVLVGGKRLIVEPPPALREQWGRRLNLHARIFLAEQVYGRPVGFTTDLPGHRDPVLDVSAFYNSLRESGFQVSDVKRVLNGEGRRRG
jgi:hypothetical protein